MRKYMFWFLSVLLAIILGWGSVSAVDISVADDIHVQPVAEFTGSGGYPEIITIENEYLKITSIPRRGRIIHSLKYKPTGDDVIYNAYKTLPMDDNGVFIYEIGGVYLSKPWNPRDVQPYDMEYEVIDDSGIKLWGTDFNTKLYTEIKMTIKDDSNSIQVSVKHINNTEETIISPYWDRFIFNPGNSPEGISLDLPVNKVEAGDSDNSWLGNPGDIIERPDLINQWKNFQSTGRFWADLENDGSKLIELSNVKSGEKVRLECDKGDFSKLEVMAYGPAYEDVMGAFPGYRLTRYTPEITLKPDELYSYKITLTVTQ